MGRHGFPIGTAALLAALLPACGLGAGERARAVVELQAGRLPRVEAQASDGAAPRILQALGLTVEGEIVLPLDGRAGAAQRVPWPSTPSYEPAALRGAWKRVRAEAELALVLEAGVTWGRVRGLFRRMLDGRAACFRVELGLPERGGTMRWLSLPVCGTPAGQDSAAGLLVQLGEEAGAQRTRISGTGAPWAVAFGCEGRPAEDVPAWGPEAGAAAARWIDDLRGPLHQEDPLHVQVLADAQVPAAEVLVLLETLQAAGVEQPDIDLGFHEEFRDPVEDGLRWLAAHQGPDGAWLEEVAPGPCTPAAPQRPSSQDAAPRLVPTSLALLAFLGQGHTNRGRHPFAKVVSRGLRYLKSVQSPEGDFGPRDGSPDLLAHAWATAALVQVYGMTGSPIWRGSADRALGWLGSSQHATADDVPGLLAAGLAVAFARSVWRDAARRQASSPALHEVDPGIYADLRREALRLPAGDGSAAAAVGLLLRVAYPDPDAPDAAVDPGLGRVCETLATQGAAADPLLGWTAALAVISHGGSQVRRWREIGEAPWREAQHGGQQPCCLSGSWDPPERMLQPGGRVVATALTCLGLELHSGCIAYCRGLR